MLTGFRNKKVKLMRLINQSGSAIIQGMISAGLLAIVGLGAASLSSNMSKHYRQIRYREAATNIARAFGSVATNNFMCSTSLKTIGGPLDRDRARYKPPGAVTGARRDALILANGQRLQICLPQLTTDGVCNHPDEWFPKNPATPTVVPNTGLQVRDIIFSGAEEVNAGALGFQYLNGLLTLVIEPEDTILGVVPLRARTGAMMMTIMTNPGRVITGCTAASSPEDFCRAVGGRYDETGPAQVPPQPVCQLMLPEMSCPVGQAMVGLNPGGTPNCVNADVQCPLGHVARNMAMNRSGVQLECEPIGAWDYSDWGPCVGGTTSRNVRCVNAAAMHQWMTTNGFTTYQAGVPANIIINNAYCPAPAPLPTGPCTMPPCTVPANTPWTVGGLTCRSSADTVIQDGQTGTALDELADPDVGDADFSCAGNPAVATFQSGTCVAGGGCGSATTIPTAIAPTTNLCSVGTASAVTDGGADWDWTCTSGTTVACSAPKPPMTVLSTCSLTMRHYDNWGANLCDTITAGFVSALNWANPGVKLDMCGQVDGNDQLTLSAGGCINSADSTHIDSYISTCEVSLGHRDNSGAIMTPFNQVTVQFNSVSSMLQLNGQVDANDAQYIRMRCPTAPVGQEAFEAYAKSKCHICLGTTDNNLPLAPNGNHTCNAAMLAGSLIKDMTDNTWSRIVYIGSQVDANDQLFLQLYCEP